MRAHARKMSKIWHDRETAPMDKAVFWTEHVMRWGKSAHLHSSARELTFTQLALLDVASIIIVTIIIIIFATFYFIVKMLQIFKKVAKEKLL